MPPIRILLTGGRNTRHNIFTLHIRIKHRSTVEPHPPPSSIYDSWNIARQHQPLVTDSSSEQQRRSTKPLMITRLRAPSPERENLTTTGRGYPVIIKTDGRISQCFAVSNLHTLKMQMITPQHVAQPYPPLIQ